MRLAQTNLRYTEAGAWGPICQAAFFCAGYVTLRIKSGGISYANIGTWAGAGENAAVFPLYGRAGMGLCGHHRAAFAEMARFQVVYDGHQPEYPGDFTSVEQTVDEAAEYLKSQGISRLDGAYGCSMGGACLTRMLALGEMPASGLSLTAGLPPKRYFPQVRIHGIPKMAHAELVMVHPEKFCRYAEKFLTRQAEEA